MGLLMETAVLEEGPRGGPLEYRPVLYSLLANLAANYQLAQAMVVDCSEAYGELLKITFSTLESSAKDSSGNGTGLALLRLWRNVSCHGDPLFKLSLSNYHERFLELLLSVEGDLQRGAELLVEVAGILTNLSSPTSSVESTGNIDWLKLYRKYPVDGFLRKAFNQQWAGNDRRKVCEPVLRSLLLMVAGAAHQREMTTFLFEQNIVERLIDLLNGERRNCPSHHLLLLLSLVKVGVELREQIFQQTKLADYLIDLMYDRNFRIKSLCTATLDMVADDGSEFARRIKAEKFTAYNAKWLAAIQSIGDRSSADEANSGSGSGGGGGGGHSMLEDLFIYPDLFLKVDSLLADSSSENFEDSDNDNQLQGGGSGGGGGSRLSQK
ncbi:Kinesin-associated protein 3 [Tyrophagus putrescentiae]|nr:Kinesin-associated protein 3 [Tyrophagus putrescentiae]